MNNYKLIQLKRLQYCFLRSVDGFSESQKSKESPEDSKPRPTARRNKSRGTTNPFIIFFLRLRSKNSHIPVTKIARIAGKQWTKMTDEQRKKYVDLANAEKKRREELKRKKLNYNYK